MKIKIINFIGQVLAEALFLMLLTSVAIKIY